MARKQDGLLRQSGPQFLEDFDQFDSVPIGNDHLLTHTLVRELGVRGFGVTPITGIPLLA
ncbi:MAG: hypothetical protein O7I42_23050 [Alphaproteobacteria bacterium]|nr:hypothetical protein [Alphaproteobacteria bacterium]